MNFDEMRKVEFPVFNQLMYVIVVDESGSSKTGWMMFKKTPENNIETYEYIISSEPNTWHTKSTLSERNFMKRIKKWKRTRWITCYLPSDDLAAKVLLQL